MTEYWHFRRARPLPKGAKTLVMGIVNLTPDSFSDGGKDAPTPRRAAQTAFDMIQAGADVIDLGAESTRPGSRALDPDREIERLGDVVARIRAGADVPVSVDTYHPETAAHVLNQGADIINDITALRGGWAAGNETTTPMMKLAARENAHVVLMHSPESPSTMQTSPAYVDVVSEVRDFLLDRAEAAMRAGIRRDVIWLDPGFGFGKTFHHNSELLLQLGELAATGFPVLAGLSRKRMIADALGLPVTERLEASLALAILASLHGAEMVRVHDVRETARAVGMVDAIHGA